MLYSHSFNVSLMNGSENPISPPFHIIDILMNLIHLSVQVTDSLVGNTRRITSTGNQTVQFREVSLLDRFPKVQ